MNRIVDPLEMVRKLPQIISQNLGGTSEPENGVTTITVDDTVLQQCFQKIRSIAKSYQMR